MRNSEPALMMNKKILVIILFMFLANMVLVVMGFLFINSHFPADKEVFAQKQKMAKDLVDFNLRLAKNLGVDTRVQVHEALSRFNYEIELATNIEDLNKVILAHGSRTQEKVLQEYEAKQRENVLGLINQDPNILAKQAKQRLAVKLVREFGVEVEPANILTTSTIDKIADIIALGNLVQDLVIDIEVENGRGQLLVPLNLAEQVRSLTKEIDSLRVTVHDLRTQAGFAELTGPGVIVKIYDAKDGHTNDAIIHETDVRDIINELFASGASGISVGNQRLTATSAIRCVGPSILVNDERIAVNPVVIRAIGDPEVLASGLDIIRITLGISRKLQVEIVPMDNIILAAYIKR